MLLLFFLTLGLEAQWEILPFIFRNVLDNSRKTHCITYGLVASSLCGVVYKQWKLFDSDNNAYIYTHPGPAVWCICNIMPINIQNTKK